MAVITLNDPDCFTILSPAEAAPAIATHVMQLQGWDADDDEARKLATAALALFASHLSGLLVATLQARGPADTIVQMLAQLRRAADSRPHGAEPQPAPATPLPIAGREHPEDAA